jgi:tripartite-type tricarboxylate transporter receptor subunit TctC
MQQRMNELVIDAAPTSPEELAAFIRDETARWAKVVKEAGIPPQ